MKIICSCHYVTNCAMSQLNSIDNFSLGEHSDLCETEDVKYKHRIEAANNSNNTAHTDDINVEYILSLLNDSGDSDGGRGTNVHRSLTETENVENTYNVSNDTSSTQVNNLKENSDSVSNVINCEEVENKNVLKEEEKLTEIHTKLKTEYRDSESSWTDDEDSSSSSSSDSDFLFESIQHNPSPKVNSVRTKGELDIEDLPPIEYLKISVEERDLKRVGQVHAVVFKLVVIQASKDEKPLDIDSVLFLASNVPLGRIFEVFGPVIEPFYTVLFNAPEDIIEKGVEVGADVFFAPHKNEITSYVFIDILRQQKGSDASWKDNNEPPEEHLDYSDDEQERAAKLKRKGKSRVRESDDDEVQVIPYKISPNEKRSFNYTSYTRDNNSEKKNIINLTPDHRNSNQNDKHFVQKNSGNLNNVPVWISSPPSYLEPKPLPTNTNFSNITPLQSFRLRKPASLPRQNQFQPLNVPSTSSQTQFRTGTLLLNPKQPFIPHQPPNSNTQKLFQSQTSSQPPNVNSQRLFQSQTPSQPPNVNSQILFHSQTPSQPPNVNSQRLFQPQTVAQPPNINSQRLLQSQTPSRPNGNNCYYPPPQRPSHQMVQNASGPILFQNTLNNVVPNQHVFGQLTPVGIMSPAPPMSSAAPMSPAIFSPCPSPAVYVPTNAYHPLPSPALSPNPFWHPQNQHTPPFTNVQSPPQIAPLTIQIPTFSSPPPIVRFSAANNYSVPPPPLPSQSNFCTSAPYSRF